MLSFLVIVYLHTILCIYDKPDFKNMRSILLFFFHLLVYTFIPKSSKKNPPKLDVNNLFALFSN